MFHNYYQVTLQLKENAKRYERAAQQYQLVKEARQAQNATKKAQKLAQLQLQGRPAHAQQ